jgi:sulfite exporter TauE/SafE
VTLDLPSVALLGTVFLTSVLGSVHCAAMCGPLVSACHAGADRRGRTDAAYHSARGLSYAVLGGSSGGVGAAVDWAGAAAGGVRVGAIVSSLLVILVGLVWMVPSLRRPRSGARGIGGVLGGRWLGTGLVKLGRRGPTLRASVLGFLTPALPCGYLYTFVLAAAGTGSILGGVSLMLAFWLGTLPALALLGFVVGKLSHTVRARAGLVTGLLLVTLGVLGVMGRGLTLERTSGVTPAAALSALGRGEGHEHATCH